MRASVRAISLTSSVGAFLAAATGLSFPVGSASVGAPGPLQVTVNAGAARHGELPPWAGYRQKAVIFDATLRIVNRSDATKELWVWTCSWPLNWQLEGKGVGWATPACPRNHVYGVSLKPGETHERKVVMFIKWGWPADKVAFRVGFTPSPRPRRGGGPSMEKGPTYWSEEVIVRAPHKDDK
jgi:hypothetical protein